MVFLCVSLGKPAVQSDNVLPGLVFTQSLDKPFVLIVSQLHFFEFAVFAFKGGIYRGGYILIFLFILVCVQLLFSYLFTTLIPTPIFDRNDAVFCACLLFNLLFDFEVFQYTLHLATRNVKFFSYFIPAG